MIGEEFVKDKERCHPGRMVEELYWGFSMFGGYIIGCGCANEMHTKQSGHS